MCRANIRRSSCLLAILLSVGLLQLVAAADTLYVDASSESPIRVGSKENPYRDLEKALEQAEMRSDITRILVAEGIYFPLAWKENSLRGPTFKLIEGVAVIGGYPPDFNEDARDPNEHPTILSGDIGIPYDYSDNCFHVVSSYDVDESAELNGFFIVGGHASWNKPTGWSGGGMYNVDSSPTIVDCSFIGNRADSYGGAIYNTPGSSPTITRCVFRSNHASRGGAIYNDSGGDVNLTDCTFIGNWSDTDGGAIYIYRASLELVNCGFFGNEAVFGGAIENMESRMRSINCVFSGNRATFGGAVTNTMSDPAYGNCTFSANFAYYDGDGTYNIQARPSFNNCILWGDSDGNGTFASDQIYMESGLEPSVLNHCWVEGPAQSLGPSFVDYDGADNIPGTADDDLRLMISSPCINAGDNGAVLGQNDYAGNPRIAYGRVDIGAFEFTDPDPWRIVYVDANAPGDDSTAKGESWANPFNDLQKALSFARDNWYVQEIRVAGGIYTPTGQIEPGATFMLVPGVAVVGGYAGSNNQDNPDVWDPRRFETILSGDVYGDDVELADPCDYANAPFRSDNCLHVVTASGADPNTALKWFTITGGGATDPNMVGGGLFVIAGSPVIESCIFQDNSVSKCGGAVYCRTGNPTFLQCHFQKNYAEIGGAVYYCNASAGAMNDCNLVENMAQYGGGIACDKNSFPLVGDCNIADNQAHLGGGIYCIGGSSPDIRGNIIQYNTATGDLADGGGIYCYAASPNIINNLIIGNIAGDDGGGIFCQDDANPLIKNNTILYNRANPQGGGIYVRKSAPVIVNCIFWSNGDDIAIQFGTPDINMSYTCIEDQDHDSGTGIGNIHYYPHFEDPQGGDYHLKPYSPCVDAGDPNSKRGDEPFSDDRINMGAYGGTREATSKRYDWNQDGVYDGMDSDFDGLPDGWEIEMFGDRSRDGTGDDDEDDKSDIEEYRGGNDPTVAHDGLKAIVYVSNSTAVPAPDGSNPLQSIQQGIDNAIDGGTVYVMRGVYNERIIIDNKNVKILGGCDQNWDCNPNEGRTELSGEGFGRRVLYVNVEGGSLAGFRITEGIEYDGAGIYLFNSSPYISDCSITKNTATDDGGGISFYKNSSAVIEGCVITNNSAADTAGGIWSRDSSPEIIDCKISFNSANSAAGMSVRNSTPLVTRCTFENNKADHKDAGIYCYEASHTVLIDCTIQDNDANNSGGGITTIGDSNAVIEDCNFYRNSPDGLWTRGGTVDIEGDVNLVGNNWEALDVDLRGNGQVMTDSESTLALNNCTVECDLAGSGTVRVDELSSLTIRGEARMNLPGPGGIICNGLLTVKENATIADCNITVTRANFEDEAFITNSVVIAEAGAPYGQFFVEDTVEISDSNIHADGDRYMDLKPSAFDGLLKGNRIFVTINEGIGQSRGGLFELRGRPDPQYNGMCEPNTPFLCHVAAVPDFDPNFWTIEVLELINDAKVDLTNRFDFHLPYDRDGENEVLYVRKLILGEGSVLNTAFNRIYYETLEGDPNSIKHEPLLGFSLNNIAFDDENEFIIRVAHNNFVDPDSTDYSRIHVGRVVGQEPDPNGMMWMVNLLDTNPGSPSYGQLFNARAKGLFAKASEKRILIWFEYLFCNAYPGTELVIYLTDAPELLRKSDPNYASHFDDHYLEVGRLQVPPEGRPGSPGSNRFGYFHEVVPTGDLDFIRGTRIEFELIGPAGSCVFINNWDPGVLCDGNRMCGDVAGYIEGKVTALDVMAIYSECGRAIEGTNSGYGCLDLNDDGYVTLDDALMMDWLERKHLCPDYISVGSGAGSAGSLSASPAGDELKQSVAVSPASSNGPGCGLLILGKEAYDPQTFGVFPADDLYWLGKNCNAGNALGTFNHVNVRVVRDKQGNLYVLNLNLGLVRLADSHVVVPAHVSRYKESATVYVGYQDYWGTLFPPIQDAAFDKDGFVYVLPVIVEPDFGGTYAAAAKLELMEGQMPAYRVVEIYDDPLFSLQGLREIETDDNENVFILNARNPNKGGSEAISVFDANTGEWKNRLELDGSQLDIPAAVGMEVPGNMLCVGSSLNKADADSTKLYAIPKQLVLGTGGSVDDVKTTVIEDMGHITDITEDTSTSTVSVWVVGFTISELPSKEDMESDDTFGKSHEKPFYKAALANVVPDVDILVEADVISDYSEPGFDLALPLSVVWTGATTACSGARIDEKDGVNLAEFAVLGCHWGSSCTDPDWCAGADMDENHTVDMADLAEFLNYWLVPDTSQ